MPPLLGTRGAAAASALGLGSGGDPFFANVSLLLHGDGTNGSTTFIDSSRNAFTATVNGSTEIRTAIKKFGTGSIYNPGGTSDRITFASDPAFAMGTGDFTIEAWIYPTTSWGGYDGIFTVGVTNGILFGKNNSGFGLREYGVGDLIQTTPPALNTWTHVAVSRQSTNLRLFVDGVLVDTVTNSSNFAQGGAMIANTPAIASFGGYIDELRVTKGIARYTSTFALPTQAFPNQ